MTSYEEAEEARCGRIEKRGTKLKALQEALLQRAPVLGGPPGRRYDTAELELVRRALALLDVSLDEADPHDFEAAYCWVFWLDSNESEIARWREAGWRHAQSAFEAREAVRHPEAAERILKQRILTVGACELWRQYRLCAFPWREDYWEPHGPQIMALLQEAEADDAPLEASRAFRVIE